MGDSRHCLSRSLAGRSSALSHQELFKSMKSKRLGEVELLGDGGDAAGSLHDETHLHVGQAVLLGLRATLVRHGHVQVEAQRHRLLAQLGVPSEEGALPLFDHLVDLLRLDGAVTLRALSHHVALENLLSLHGGDGQVFILLRLSEYDQALLPLQDAFAQPVTVCWQEGGSVRQGFGFRFIRGDGGVTEAVLQLALPWRLRH